MVERATWLESVDRLYQRAVTLPNGVEGISSLVVLNAVNEIRVVAEHLNRLPKLRSVTLLEYVDLCYYKGDSHVKRSLNVQST